MHRRYILVTDSRASVPLVQFSVCGRRTCLCAVAVVQVGDCRYHGQL